MVRGVRVTHFTDTYLPRRDGVITSIRTLVDALTEDGHQALTVVPRHPDQPADQLLLRLRAVPCGLAGLRVSPWFLRGAAAEKTLAEVARHGPDVIHVHTPGPVGLLGVLAACRLRLPLVQTYHTDLHAYAEAYRFPAPALRVGVRLYAHRLKDARPHQRRETVGPGRRGALDACNELLLSDCDALVVPTQAVLDRIRLPVAQDRTFLVPSGVAPRPTAAAAVAGFRDRHAIATTDRVVLFVGRINREKGIDLLIDAFDRLLAACPQARLVLVGAMYEPKWFASLLRRVSPAVTSRVVLAGEQPADVVAAAYGSADVFAFPSRTDTQALVLQEAALAGLPAVLVDRVLHQHGALGPAAGICTEPDPGAFAAALLWLLDHPDQARDLGQHALAQASRHTPAQYAAAVLDVYRHAARNRASTGAVAVV